MICRYCDNKIKQILFKQIHSNFFLEEEDIEIVEKYMPMVLERLERNFEKNTNKYYSCIDKNGEKHTYFDPLHTCQWLVFLYYFANTVFKEEKSQEAREFCDKLYAISKMMSGADIYYEVELPDVFCCDHPVGAVIGRGKIGENFAFIQGCTIGNNRGIYPVIGNNVTMYSNSKIVGNCKIGDNVVVSANVYIKDQDVPENVVVYGTSPNLVFKEKE